MKIGIIGMGYVGTAMKQLLLKNHQVVTKDLDYGEDFDGCELVIVCVPTPTNQDGSCDISIVDEVISGVDCDDVLIRSTVPPGTCLFLSEKYRKDICFCPEYIGESSYHVPEDQGYPHTTDMSKSPFMIFGGMKFLTLKMVQLFSPIMGPYCKMCRTDSTTAELTKYMENCFFAVKNAFCNDFYNIAKLCNVDYEDLRELWLADKRIDPCHSMVFVESRGFGGKCLPKDILAMVTHAKQLGHTATILEAALQFSQSIRVTS